MRISTVTILMLLAPALVALEIATTIPLARPGLPLHVVLQAPEFAAHTAVPLTMESHLWQGDRELGSARLWIEDAGVLQTGVHQLLRVPDPMPAGPLRLQISLRDAAGRRLASTALSPRNSMDLLTRLERLNSQAQPHLATDPHLAVMLRRCLGLLSETITLAAAEHADAWMDLIAQRLADPTTALPTAYHDPIDGSAQPYRLHAIENPAFLAVVLRGADSTTRAHRWPALEPSLLSHLHDRQASVLQPYPAGDRTFDGIAAARLPFLLQHVQDAATPNSLKNRPVVLIGTASTVARALHTPGLQVDGVAITAVDDMDALRSLRQAEWQVWWLGERSPPLGHLEPLPQAPTAQTPPPPRDDRPAPTARPFLVTHAPSDNLQERRATTVLLGAFAQRWLDHAHAAPRWAQPEHIATEEHAGIATIVCFGVPTVGSDLGRRLQRPPVLDWQDRESLQMAQWTRQDGVRVLVVQGDWPNQPQTGLPLAY